jgi:hypothetical protein
VIVRITQLDGELPNLALMRLAAWHRSEGHRVECRRSVTAELDEPRYDRVYASAIFTKSRPLADQMRVQWEPERLWIGGTGVDPEVGPKLDVDLFVPTQFTALDYSVAPPNFTASLGFTSRGCRFKCKFCGVPWKEGRPSAAQTVAQIWRGPGHPKKLHLLDNDVFGNPDWKERIEEIKAGGFRVCINQGVNVRIINHEATEALASIEYRDQSFRRRRLYTAWDQLGDERVFFRGVDRLQEHGIPPSHLMAYMLVGFAEDEDWDQIFHRFQLMVERGIKPYIMPYQPARGRVPEEQLLRFERWCNLGLYRFTPWDEYNPRYRGPADDRQLEARLEGVRP